MQECYAREHGLDYQAMLSASDYKERYRLAMIEWNEESHSWDPGYFCRAAIKQYTGGQQGLPTPHYRFRCPKCPQVLASSWSVDSHDDQAHSVPVVTLPDSPVAPAGRPRRAVSIPDFAARIGLQKKVMKPRKLKTTQQKLKSVNCDLCGILITEKRNLKRHKDSKHSNKSLSCTELGCSSKFHENSKDELKAHIENIHRGVFFSCPHCDSRFTRQSNMRTHVKESHKKKKFFLLRHA